MALYNANSKFTSKKKLSVSVVRIPKNVKEALNITSACSSGIFKIEPGDGRVMYDRGYIFEDINYITQDNAKKESILLQLMTWFKNMNTQFKITVANERRSIEALLDDIYHPITDDKVLEDGIGEWICEKVASGVRDVNKVLYLTVTCTAVSYEEAKLHFATLDTSLARFFSFFKSRLYRLGGVERLELIRRILAPKNTVGLRAPDTDNDRWKNDILPASIEQFKDYMILDNTYVSVLFAHSYDQIMNEEKTLQSLMELPYPLYVTLDMEPVDKLTLKDKLTSALVNNEKVKEQDRVKKSARGQFSLTAPYRIQKKEDEIRDYMDEIDENDEQSVFVGLLVIACADTLDDLIRCVEGVQTAGKTGGYVLDTYNFRQLKALNTALPIGGRQVNHMRLFLSSKATVFNPFFAKDVKAQGYIYGMNRTTKQLIRTDRKKLSNPHGFISGHSGSGKSFFIKETEIAQTLLFTTDDMIILDPQNEFEYFIVNHGGQFFDLTPQGNIHLNPFEVPSHILKGDVTARNVFVASKKEYAATFVEAVMTNITVTQVHKTYIGRAVSDVYDQFFSKKLKRQPTWVNVWEHIRMQMQSVENEGETFLLSDIANSLEQFVIGAYDMFAKPTDLDITHRLVGFGLKNVPASIWEPVMVTIMHFLAERMNYNQTKKKAVHLIVDEAQELCRRQSSAFQLLKAVETYRKFGGIVTLAVQNLTRVLEHPELRDMFSNCAFKVFFDQGGVDAVSLSEILELSSMEYRSLEESIPGYGLFVCEGEVLLLDCGMSKSNPLYKEFSTNFHEKNIDSNVAGFGAGKYEDHV